MNKPYFSTTLGKILLGDTLQVLEEHIEPKSADLILTSPPYALLRKKDFDNASANDYLEWFKPFGDIFKRVLKDNGSLVINICGSWVKGQPTTDLYHFKLLIMLCDELGFHLAQEFYWYNPTGLPTPVEWTAIRRIRVRTAVDCIWWLSPTPYPKADNKRVLQPYSDRMKRYFITGIPIKEPSPSGHSISRNFVDTKGSIPPNLIVTSNNDSIDYYHQYCKTHNIKRHSARFPTLLPEYFIRFLTNKGDLVVDPFAGSCTTGEVAERLGRQWVCIDDVEEHLKGAVGRFDAANISHKRPDKYYKVPRPGMLWDDSVEEVPLDEDGGRTRKKRANK